jgi:hypothetical protein
VTAEFRHTVYERFFAGMTKLVKKHFPRVETLSNHSWDGAISAARRPGSLADIGPRFFTLYRSGALTQALTEDWLAWQFSSQIAGYLTEIFRAATRDTRARYGAYVIALGPDRDAVAPYKAYSELAHGSKFILWYNYGPDYTGYSDHWLPTFDPARFRYLHEVDDDIGRAEPLLADARPRDAEVAILWPWSTDVWNWAHGDLSANWERSAIWLALSHAQIPSELVTEDDVAAGGLRRMKALYLVGSHLKPETARAVAQWVRAGGVLFLEAGGATRDHLDRPLDVIDRALGLHREADRKLGEILFGFNAELLVPSGTIRLEGSDTMDVLTHEQRFALPERAQVLGRFPDGAPAVAQFAVGAGQVLLCSNLPGLSYARKARQALALQDQDERQGEIPPAWPTAERELIARAAKIAHARADVVLSQPIVEATRLQGKRGVVVPLINWTLQPIAALTVRLPDAGALHTVESLRQGKLATRREGGDLLVTLPLDRRDMLLVR